MRHRPVVVGVAAIVAAGLLVGGGWALASAFQSPAQREASATPPPPAPITADVVRGDLVRDATLRVEGRRASRTTTTVPAQAEDMAVVTAVGPQSGSSITAAQRVLDVNGVPLVAMPGAFDFYRDLRPGDRGPDVDQLQRGLMAAGKLRGHDGQFGAATERAIRRLLAATGVPVAEEQTDNGTARRLVVEARRMIVFRALPAVWIDGPKVGDHLAANNVLTTESGDVELSASISDAAAADIRVGTTGQGAIGDVEQTLRVARLGPAQPEPPQPRTSKATSGTAEPGAEPGAQTGEQTVVLVGADAPLPATWAGATLVVSLRVEVAALGALLVPTVAVVPGGDHDAQVSVRRSDGTFHRVAIREIAALDGRSAVEPIRAGALTVGDRVRVR